VVDTRGITAEYRMSHWAQIVRERSDSGLSVREYCKNAGIKQNTYYYWLKKLREVAAEEIMATRYAQQPTRPAQPIFTELKLPPKLETPSAFDSNKQICVEAGGMRVTAGSEYPVEKLADLLKAVMRPCC